VRDLQPPNPRRGNFKKVEINNIDFEENSQSLITPPSGVGGLFDMEIVNQLKEMVGVETLLSVYEDFEREAEEQILNAKNAFAEKDVKMIQRELHTLKGNSGTIGLMRIHEIVEKIEVPAKTGDLTDFEKNMAVLEKEFEDFRKNYASILILRP
jgi:HPt (histidine-containing phosphotransfer) domain-containing protein